MSDISMIGMLERYLQLASNRNTLVTANVANVDTPGYHTRDIDFRGELVRALDTEAPAMAPVVRQVSGLVERPDGNNVSIDREGMALAESQLQFRVGVQLIKSEFHRWTTAINEGK